MIRLHIVSVHAVGHVFKYCVDSNLATESLSKWSILHEFTPCKVDDLGHSLDDNEKKLLVSMVFDNECWLEPKLLFCA